MPKPISLKDLVQAIAGAVTQAQHEIEMGQLANLRTFFDAEGKPDMLHMKVPALRSTAEHGETDDYVVPTLTLIQNSPLHIKKVDVDFDVELGDMDADSQEYVGDALEQRPASWHPRVSVFHQAAGLLKKKGITAHIKLELESLEQSEGVARLLNDMNALQGRVRPTDGVPKPPESETTPKT
jgi:hypothetical protein